MKKKTLRLIYPEWHGGVNPNYVFGSKLLSCIASPSETDETVEIEVKTDFDSPVAQVNGIDCGEAIRSGSLYSEVIVPYRKFPSNT